MTYLVDTHYLVWSLVEPGRIPRRHVGIIESAADPKYVSTVSYWELSLKYALGKIHLRGATPEELLRESEQAGFRLWAADAYDFATSHSLPFAGDHRDPFDRLPVWQSIRHGLTLLTSDEELSAYTEHGLHLG